MKIEFGTGGWRVPQEEFTTENIYRVVNAVGLYINNEYNKSNANIIIGYDNRNNSFKAAIEAFNILYDKFGFKVKIFDKSVTTPTVMKYVSDYYCDLGVMITASHNPATFNGIKIIEAGGRDATIATTKQIESFCELPIQSSDLTNVCVITEKYIKNKQNSYAYEVKYVDDVLSTINTDIIKNKQFKIVFDNMHSSGHSLFNNLIYKLNVFSNTINFTGIFRDKNYIPCPTEENNKRISEILKNSNEYNFGIAFDGDADRLGIIDENGNFIDGNDMLCLFTWYMYEYRNLKTPVAVSCCSTDRVSAISKDYGCETIETPIGVKYLVEQIINNGINFAGEQNGGVIFPNHLLGKDSIYTLAILLEMLAVTEKTLSELIDDIHQKYGNTYCISTQVDYVGEKDRVKEKIENLLPTFIPSASVSKMDGVKLRFAQNNFLMCRLSGTEPIIRILVESSTKEQSEIYVNTCKKVLKEELGVI